MTYNPSLQSGSNMWWSKPPQDNNQQQSIFPPWFFMGNQMRGRANTVLPTFPQGGAQPWQQTPDNNQQPNFPPWLFSTPSSPNTRTDINSRVSRVQQRPTPTARPKLMAGNLGMGGLSY